MSSPPLPSLSPAGWLKTPAEIADTALAHAFAANKSQTQLYPGKVVSVQYLIEQYSHDIPTLMQKMRQELNDYYLRYFPEGVDIDVQGDPSSDALNNKIVLRLIITFVDSGKQYSLPNTVDIVNGKFAKLARLNNTGIFS
jgi:hypothetical protein